MMRPSDSDRNLVQGCDLTSLGLNLNSSEYVIELRELLRFISDIF
jgi:hypothetical protein